MTVWTAKVQSYIDLPPLVVLILKELDRHDFKTEYEFSAIVTASDSDISWKNYHIREVRVYGKPTQEILTFLEWCNFKPIDGGWAWRNKSRKLELVKLTG